MSKEPKYLIEVLQANNIIVCSFNSLQSSNEIVDDSIRILARLSDIEVFYDKIEECKVSTSKFCEDMKGILKEAYETKKERYINGCTMVSRFLKKKPQHLADFKEIIGILIKSVKDKVGLMRKNAAILLSVIAMDEGNKEVVRSLHGIEVLHSVKDFL
jgi:hypothetical protein